MAGRYCASATTQASFVAGVTLQFYSPMVKCPQMVRRTKLWKVIQKADLKRRNFGNMRVNSSITKKRYAIRDYKEIFLNSGSPIVHGGTFSVTLEFTASRTLSEVTFGIGLCNIDGVRLATIESDSKGSRLSIQKGSGKITLALSELLLQPGSYSLDVGARSGEMFPLDYLPSCARFDVLPSFKSKQNSHFGGSAILLPAICIC